MKRKIHQNLWAGHKTYFIPTHPVRSSRNEPSKTGGYELVNIDGKWRLDANAVYYSRDLKDEEHFPAVGNISDEDIESALINFFLSAISKEGDSSP